MDNLFKVCMAISFFCHGWEGGGKGLLYLQQVREGDMLVFCLFLHCQLLFPPFFSLFALFFSLSWRGNKMTHGWKGLLLIKAYLQ